jgi:hypothetical protein
VRNEPQSEPFVGQARIILIENIFFGNMPGSGKEFGWMPDELR